MNRRKFIKTAALSATVSQVALHPAAFAQTRSSRRKMTMSLVCGSLGINVGQRQAIKYAHLFGFESVEARPEYLATLERREISELKRDLRKMQLVWGSASLPVDFRRDQATFQDGLQKLPKLAAALQRAGVRRIEYLAQAQQWRSHLPAKFPPAYPALAGSDQNSGRLRSPARPGIRGNHYIADIAQIPLHPHHGRNGRTH